MDQNPLSDAAHELDVADTGHVDLAVNVHEADGLFGGGMVVTKPSGPVAVSTTPTETTVIGPDGMPRTVFGADADAVADLVANA